VKQLVQRLGDGRMRVVEVSRPMLEPGRVLVHSHFSLISAGTERSTVKAARDSLLGKARARPQQAREVVDSLRRQGPSATWRAVRKRLDAWTPLGYSLAGEVLAVAGDVAGLRAGDRVACAGAGYANHAEVNAVPAKLCVRLRPDADLAAAAYNTLGAIALQGIRQADLRLGETAAVLGLGLLGRLTGLMLRASGVRVFGLDLSAEAVRSALGSAVDEAATTDQPGLDDRVARFSAGIGLDAVIITAATTSLEPVNLAGRLLRKRGTVVVVGDVPTGFAREPHYYRKELTLRMSCSYGPGRYDPQYEEKGRDYPAGYVRWTENRNMAAFQELLAAGRVDVGTLTTHRFPLDRVAQAYDLILEGRERHLGVLVEYPQTPPVERRRLAVRSPAAAREGLGVAFIGAGSHAQSHLLPAVRAARGVRLTGVMTSTGASSLGVAERFGFAFTAARPEAILEDEDTAAVFVASRHDSHARYVCAALEASRHVFVEKPLCLDRGELAAIEAAAGAAGARPPLLTVGYNRRCAPLATALREFLGAGPMSALYRVNAGPIPAQSWIQDPEVGGGRIVGEVCHFVDFLVFVTGSLPSRVHAETLRDAAGSGDTLSVTLAFEDGSVASLLYLANGASGVDKEYVEVHRGGCSAVLRDFRELLLDDGRRRRRRRLASPDKGQRALVHAFLDAARGGGANPVPLDEALAVSEATFEVLDAARGTPGDRR